MCIIHWHRHSATINGLWTTLLAMSRGEWIRNTGLSVYRIPELDVFDDDTDVDTDPEMAEDENDQFEDADENVDTKHEDREIEEEPASSPAIRGDRIESIREEEEYEMEEGNILVVPGIISS